MAQSWPSHHDEKEGNNMIARVFEMRRSVAVIVVACLLIVGEVTGAALSSWAKQNPAAAAPSTFIVGAGKSREAGPPNAMGFAPVLKPALAAVVDISSSRIVKTPQAPFSPFFEDPFFRQFLGDEFFRQMPREQREQSLGSSVIVTEDGYILTNNHVEDKATDIKVAQPDKREFKGKVVGSDPKTDVAVVKISASSLPTLSFGDSDKLQVGDYVFAIGDPFGIGETATMGIVSATGRGGLAIEKHGKVTRGYLGVMIQEVSPDLAKAFKAPEGKGALVGDITSDGNSRAANSDRSNIREISVEAMRRLTTLPSARTRTSVPIS
jgi:S1-C subfamily serine protease